MLVIAGRWQMQQDNNFLPCFYIVIVLSLNILLKCSMCMCRIYFGNQIMLIIIEPSAEHLAFVLMPQLQHGVCAMWNMPSAPTSSAHRLAGRLSM